MASGNQSPRQKMINMMYLVLTALLALNVSKEILDAFVVVNMGLLQQKENLDSKNLAAYNELQHQLIDDSANTRIQMLVVQAGEVRKLASETDQYIEALKLELVKKVDGADDTKALQLVKSPSLVSKKDDYDGPTHFFGTNNPPGKNGKAAELKQKLTDYKDRLLSIADLVLSDTIVKEPRRSQLKDEITQKLSLLNTSDPSGEGGEVGSWEMQYFYHLPLSAALTELTKWQNFVKGGESDMLTFLWNETSRNSYKFDEIRAAVIPVSNFVTSGSDFEADVFLSAFSTSPSNKPKIVFSSEVNPTTGELVNPVTLPMENVVNGVGKVKLPTTGSGERNFAGYIEMTDPNGDSKTYPFNTSYNVAPPSATISPTAMNVFYIGLKNPLSISVPGVAPNNISISGTNCQISGSNGKYEVTVTGGKLATVSVSARMQDGSMVSMGRQEFRIKGIPTPTVMVGGLPSNSAVSASILSKSAVIPDMSGFVFDNVYAKVVSFDVSFTGNNGYRNIPNIQGNLIPTNASQQIAQLRPGARVYFDNIKILVPPNTYKSTSAVYTIK